MIKIDINKVLDVVDKMHVSDEEKGRIVQRFNELANDTTNKARQHENVMQKNNNLTSLQRNIRPILALLTVVGVLAMFFLDMKESQLAMGLSLATVTVSYYFGSAEKELVTKDEQRHERSMTRLEIRKQRQINKKRRNG